MREFKVGKVYLDTDCNTEVKVEIIDIENNHIYFSGYEMTDFFREHNGFYQFALDIRLEHLTSGRYKEVLKIGDTFEYNGFVCEVKEEIKKWYKVEDNISNKVAFEKLYKQDVLDIEKLPYAKLTEITNKEFIKQLEENVR